MISRTLQLTACATLGIAALTHSQTDQGATPASGTNHMALASVVEMERMDPPASAGARWISVSPSRKGGIIASWIEPVPSEGGEAEARTHPMRMRFSRFASDSWTEPTTVVQSDRLFVNWADFPSVSESDGALVAHFLERSGEGTYAYDVQLARSTDGGRSWTRLGPAHDDGVQAEHGFVSFAAGSEGTQAFWLDGRETAGGGGHGGGGGNARGRMTLRTARIGEEGATDGDVIDASVCDCCSTDAAMTSAGPIVVYRDRSFGEVRDIAIVRKTRRGWTKPRLVHADGWEIAACPVNGPVVAAEGEHVVVAWYTGDTKNGGGRVLASFSSDGGATFGRAFVVDSLDDDGFPMGRVDVLLDDNGDAIVSWLDSAKDGQGAVRLRRVSPEGTMTVTHTAFSAFTSRRSGFARLERFVTSDNASRSDDGNQNEPRHAAAIIAWTNPEDGLSVHVGRFALDTIR